MNLTIVCGGKRISARSTLNSSKGRPVWSSVTLPVIWMAAGGALRFCPGQPYLVVGAVRVQPVCGRRDETLGLKPIAEPLGWS